MRDWLYWRIYPGLNLHARARYKILPTYLCHEAVGSDSYVLDAGCGNGMLSYRAYLLGARVLGISIKDNEVRKAKRLFNEYLSIPEQRLRFVKADLYKMEYAESEFDAIICSEVLEHLRKDRDVCGEFCRLLRPGGVVHICAPNAEHPYNKAFPLDHEEKGGHVRPGYTEATYRELLEPLGFRIEQIAGMGGPIRQTFNRWIKELQWHCGAVSGLPLFLVALGALWFERHDVDPPEPFSIYVKARKPLVSN